MFLPSSVRGANYGQRLHTLRQVGWLTATTWDTLGPGQRRALLDFTRGELQRWYGTAHTPDGTPFPQLQFATPFHRWRYGQALKRAGRQLQRFRLRPHSLPA